MHLPIAENSRCAYPWAGMSEHIKHECGLALVRLRQPLSYYQQKYQDAAWGLRKLYLLMEKQHNRGQDGAGVAVVKFGMPPGTQYIKRIRSEKHNAIERVFDTVMKDVKRQGPERIAQRDTAELKRKCAFLGEVMIGHLRYATHSGNSATNCHPYIRSSNTASRNLAIAGNFNMTNSTELFNQLVEWGLNPVGDSDTQVILERLGYCLDREHEHLRSTMGPDSLKGLDGKALAGEVSNQLDMSRILKKASEGWDGGYTLIGLIGNGDAFAFRDPSGIRPGFFYIDDEVVAIASERIALANVFDVDTEKVEPIEPGRVFIIKRDGEIKHVAFTDPLEPKQCTFERVYFSRGNDPEIYRERKALGAHLATRVYEALNGDVENAVFSYIPNTADAAYRGLVAELDRITRVKRIDQLWECIESGKISRDDVERLYNGRLRTERVAQKDQRLRTFITHDAARRDLVAHIYDITRGVVKPTDTLVVVDDSIVRGTTLRESIITMLSRLGAKNIIFVSSAPPIMYPDCYGIDMSELGRFVAFEAAVALLKERSQEHILDEVQSKCQEQANLPSGQIVNHVAAIYDGFSLDELSAKIAQLVRPKNLRWDGDIQIIYQTVEGLRKSIPNHHGDWYFTGNYPTPGGFKVLNTSYLNWRAGTRGRAYEPSPTKS